MVKIALVGAVSSAIGYGSLLDAVNIEAIYGSELVLHDTDPQRLDAMTCLAGMMNDDAGASLHISKTLDPCEALHDADYVIAAIEVDRFNRWRLDYEIPFKHGVKQALGEHGGPGGLFHTWRNLPPVLDVARAMEDECPDAWLLNCTGPVPRINLAVSRHTSIKSIGLDRDVEVQLHRVAKFMGVPASLIDVVSAGLNRFSWFKEIRLTDGSDAYPLLDEALKDAKGFQPLCRAMYDRFGLYPSAGDNHLGEYLAYGWEATPEWQRGINWIDRREREEKESWMRIRSILDGKTPLDVRGRLSGERAMHIIAGMMTGSNHLELQVNMPNTGQVGNILIDAVVETPAVITRGGVKPIEVGDLPEGLAALLNIQSLVHGIAVDVGVSGDMEKARQALLLDPVVPDDEKALKAFDELMMVHSDLLPQFSVK